ncbi:MAG: U32 family peptidase, partial [Ruminococcus sp.]|nr:U32 family peptidase [Ruminococcus sp.]
MKNKIEILAPAGSQESLIAAVRSGADAVYLGAKDFSARASAQNFSKDELKEAIAYCRVRGVKTYLTVNTLMFDEEIEKAVNLITDAYLSGIDAVITQDIGLARILRKHLPDLRLHGSTQMSVHTPSGAKALYEMGFSRVVLSRELSFEEIKEIRNACDIELEVFVHGALCMSVSGQCYFSSMLGGRSGNRGMCAQPCRLPFCLKGGSDHALSLKDNSLIEYIKDLEEIGVHSAKIEGRMKRPEYVAAATSACREKRDTGVLCEETARRLESVFSRTGFTDGYLIGKRTGDMFGYRRKEDVTATDEKLLSSIRNSYKDELQRIGVEFEFTAKHGKEPSLFVTDGERGFIVHSDTPAEKALNVATTKEKITSLLKKCGNTPYYPEKITCNIDKDISIPASKINELRRQALANLSALRSVVFRDAPKPFSFSVEGRKSAAKPLLRARFKDADIPKEYKNCDLVFVPLFTRLENFAELRAQGFNIGAEIPRGMFGKEEKIKAQLLKLKDLGIIHVLASNIGAVYLAKKLGLTIHGGFGLNICNTASLLWAEEYGLKDTELSFELTKEQINSLGGDLPRGIISYGYLPLMLTRACPGSTAKGGCKSCSQNQILQDRMNKNFIFTCDGNSTEILNCVPLLIPEKINDFCNLDFHVFRFSV